MSSLIPFDVAYAVTNDLTPIAKEEFEKLIASRLREDQTPWSLYLSSRSISNISADLDVSRKVASELLIENRLEPPAHLQKKFDLVVAPSLPSFMTALPQRQYRVAFIRMREYYLMRVTHNSAAVQPLNIHLRGYFYPGFSDMLEKREIPTPSIINKAFMAIYTEILATRLRRFGMHFMDLVQFPERLQLVEAAGINEYADSKDPKPVNNLIPVLFPKIVQHDFATVHCASFASGDRPISVTESKMKLFFGADFNSIRNRLMIIEPNGILTYFYGANVPNLKNLIETGESDEEGK